MKVLSIGNSFSQDAQRYLHRISRLEGMEMKCMNLYIGGCTLERHYRNMLGDIAAYELEINGENSQFLVSMKDALLSDSWDIVTLQQVSHQAPYYDTYEPYLTKIAEYVRLYAPKAKIYMHQTWAYEQDSKRLNEELGFGDQHEMFDMIEKAYQKAAEGIGADGIIPCGEAMLKAVDAGIGKIHRDTFHADLGIGRYMLGLVWYKVLTGKTAQNILSDLDIAAEAEKLEIIKNVVNNI